ncbi:hypothetical protein O6H91_08G100900 [Diphasiastrum complanatum]|nr:hypothetical protein O6H91_08G100900 [Diphasiastrum complanatum]
MTPHVLEIPTGYDVGESVAAFARKGQRGLFILTGSGSVSNVALRQPSAVGSTVTFHGCFEILAMSGAFIFQPTAYASAGLTISLAGAQGQVLGGNVVGALVAASPVLVIAASFLGPSYDRLPDVEANDEAKLLAAATTISVSPPDPSSTGLYSIAPSPFGGYQLPPDILAWAAGPRTQL